MAIPKLNNVYVGERYIPKYEGTWDETKDYEGLVIVNYNNSSYVSKRPVPAGIPVTNVDYWALMSNFGGKLTELEEKVSEIEREIDSGEIAGGTWVNAKTLGIVPGIDIGPIINSLPSDVPNIAFPAGEYTVNTACTINVPTMFAPGAYLNTTATVTFGKETRAGRDYIFRYGETGTVRYLPTGATIFPEWWGWFPQSKSGGDATGEEKLNASNLVQPTISFGAGTYAGGSLVWNQKNITLIGKGKDNTALSFTVLDFSNANYLVIKDMFLDTNLILNTTVTISDCYINSRIQSDNDLVLSLSNVHSTDTFNIVNNYKSLNISADNITVLKTPFINFTPANEMLKIKISNSKLGLLNDPKILISAPFITSSMQNYSMLEISNSEIFASEIFKYDNTGGAKIMGSISNSLVYLKQSSTDKLPSIAFTGCTIHLQNNINTAYSAFYMNCRIIDGTVTTKRYEGVYTNCVIDGGNVLTPQNNYTSYINCEFVGSTNVFNGPNFTCINTPLGKHLVSPTT